MLKNGPQGWGCSSAGRECLPDVGEDQGFILSTLELGMIVHARDTHLKSGGGGLVRWLSG